MTYRLCVGAFALACLVVLSPAARAVVIVNDTWIDDTDFDQVTPTLTYSENGMDVDGDGDIESAWFRGNAGTFDPVAGGGPGPLRGDLTGTGASSASWTTYFTPEGSEVNLANNGDSLRLTWKFQLSGVNLTNSSQAFRFALVDADTRLTTNASPPSAIYAGYAIYGNMGQTLGNSGPFQLRERTLLTSGSLLVNSGDFNATLGNGATNGAVGYAAATDYTLVWQMTRVNTSELAIDVSMNGGSLDGDGVAQVQFTDISPNSFKYDTFSLRPSQELQTASIFDTSLFKVEFLPGGGGGPTLNANFNGDAQVDGDDLLIWQRNLGATGQTSNVNGDANGNGIVGGEDLQVWRDHFGQATASSVPEPSSLACGMAAIAALVRVARRRRG